MWKLLLVLLVLQLIKRQVCLSEDAPEVQTPLGKIRGLWKTTLNGRKFALFEGIPYAKPPVGDLRFEEPQPIEPWSGIWHATKTYTCSQMSFDPKNSTIIGEEDCLYVNVYVPEEYFTKGKTFDVLATIHGGAFMLGSGHMMANPTVLLDKDMILVSLNYRVAFFGFLSTEDDSIPGNNGMKDQVLALKWIQGNIASFGGDPKSVTISGLSAGGVGVHLHYFSPMSEGLFVRGISQSGTALNAWAINDNPLEKAKKLAVLVGCPDSSTTELKECLKQRPAQLLMEKINVNFYGFGNLPIAPFAPVIEKNAKNPFLAEKPYTLIKQGKVLDVPWITSVTANEGLLPSAFFYSQLEQINQMWSEIAHYALDYNYTLPISKRKEVANKIKDFYLGSGQDINKENFYKFTKIFTDGLFLLGAEKSVKLQSSIVKSPVYFYYFNYAKGTNKATNFFSQEPIEGVCHGEDMVYFYGITRNPYSENDKMLKDTCLDIVHSFVTTGTPSFDNIDEWKPVKGHQLVYLNITDVDNIKMQTVDELAPHDFWDKLELSENKYIKDEL